MKKEELIIDRGSLSITGTHQVTKDKFFLEFLVEVCLLFHVQ